MPRVTWNAIHLTPGTSLYEKMVTNILDRLADGQRIRVALSDAVAVALRERCISDLSHGGRGIGTT